ncbi:hypothetical protein SEEK9263_13945 [Salmonella enterica subsp. enterica serovar Kentucky str. ATCC 9263]|nr:hypothetical protein SEEM841_11957 [Salmonella enterica subsp. enterica serovar Senftenberg str. 423984-1]ESG74397.1 hypothetical protein SEEK9263_13945 [Salmonella enterica subsp. enterica serovar Kentucky str. ATCC 9263]
MLKIPPLAGFFLPEFSADDPRHKKKRRIYQRFC